jgi:hypothetical protein
MFILSFFQERRRKENKEASGDREKSYEKKGEQTKERKRNLQSVSQTGDREREMRKEVCKGK